MSFSAGNKRTAATTNEMGSKRPKLVPRYQNYMEEGSDDNADPLGFSDAEDEIGATSGEIIRDGRVLQLRKGAGIDFAEKKTDADPDKVLAKAVRADERFKNRRRGLIRLAIVMERAEANALLGGGPILDCKVVAKDRVGHVKCKAGGFEELLDESGNRVEMKEVKPTKDDKEGETCGCKYCVMETQSV